MLSLLLLLLVLSPARASVGLIEAGLVLPRMRVQAGMTLQSFVAGLFVEVIKLCLQGVAELVKATLLFAAVVYLVMTVCGVTMSWMPETSSIFITQGDTALMSLVKNITRLHPP